MKDFFYCKRSVSAEGKIIFSFLLLCIISLRSLAADPLQITFETTGGTHEVCQGVTFSITGYVHGAEGEEKDLKWEWSAAPGMISVHPTFPDLVVFNTLFTTNPGVYLIELTVTDSNNNTGTGQISITLKKTHRVVIWTEDAVTFCQGGSAMLSALPSEGFTYNWRRNQADIPLANQPEYLAELSGSYRVRMTSENGCSHTSNDILITVNPLPQVSASSEGMVCEGSDLQLFSQPSAAPSYSWSSQQDPSFSSSQQNPVLNQITKAQAGLYTVLVTDNNGCSNSASTMVQVEESPQPPLSLQANFTHICEGEQGELVLTANGGSGEILNWYSGNCMENPIGQGNPLIIPFPETTTTYYASWSKDLCGSSECESITVEVSGLPEVILQADHVSCFGANDGKLMAEVNGQHQPWSYLWNTGSEEPAIESLAPGTYWVKVTNAMGCSTTVEETITGPDELVVLISEQVNVSCHDLSDGRLTVKAEGGTPDYNFLWDNGQTGPEITDLAAGKYTIHVTDAAGCFQRLEIEISQPEAIQMRITSLTQVPCFGESTGSATVEASHGNEPYTYEWSNGQSGPTATNLQAGIYLVTATDANGCMQTLEVAVGGPEHPIIFELITEDVLCKGASTGSIEANVSGGIPFSSGPQYYYLWNTGAQTPSISGLTAGTYTLQVTDDSGCVQQASVDIEEPEFALEAFAGENSVMCHPDNSGSWILGGNTHSPTATGGTQPYSWLWSSNPADASLEGQENLENPLVSPLTATTYTLLVTDAAGCTHSHQVVIDIHDKIIADAGGDEEGNLYLCEGQSVILGGSPAGLGKTAWLENDPDAAYEGFGYLWKRIHPGPETEISTLSNPEVSPTETSVYVLIVTDFQSNNCSASDTVQVVILEALQLSLPQDQQACFSEGYQYGFELTASVSGGSGNYQYIWSSEPEDPSLEGQKNHATPVVSPQQTTTYYLKVNDPGGMHCFASAEITLSILPEIIVDAGENSTVWHPENGDSFSLGGNPTAQGGDGNFTYLWSSQPEDPSLAGQHNVANPEVSPMQTTVYQVLVTDGNGCQQMAEVIITVADQLKVNAGDDVEICHPDNGGFTQLNASAAGGSAPYSWLWSPAEGLDQTDIANPVASPLTQTTYQVTVTDALGGQASATVTVSVKEAFVADAGEDITICHPQNNGQAFLEVSISGGSGNFQYLWSSVPEDIFIEGQKDQKKIQVNPEVTTTYVVFVIDLENPDCYTSDTITVFINNPLVVDAGDNSPICDPANGEGIQLQALASGGSGTYISWEWTPAESLNDAFISNPVASPAVNTTYLVRVTDSYGCQASSEVSIEVLPQLHADAGPDMTVCYGVPVMLGGIPAGWGGSGEGYQYLWSPAQGLDDPTLANPMILFPSSHQTYTLVVSDPNGCLATDEVTISIAPQIIVDAGADQNVCAGSQVSLGGDPTASGGQAPYMYYWWMSPNHPMGTQANPVVTVNQTATYNLTVVDVSGCFSGNSVTIHAEPAVVAYAGEDLIICQGESASLTAEGGISFLWDTGETTATIEVSPAQTTTYSVVVSGACGKDTAFVTIEVDEPTTVVLGPDLSICEGSQIVIGPQEALEGITYKWSSQPGGSYDNTHQIQIAPVETTIYQLVTENQNGCSSMGTIRVQVNPLPVAQVSDDILFCSSWQVHPVHIGGDPVAGYSYEWSSKPSGFSSESANPMVYLGSESSVWYLLKVTSPEGCVSKDSVHISVSDFVLSILGNPVLCADEDQVSPGEFVSVAGGTPPYSYQWMTPAGEVISQLRNPVFSAPFEVFYQFTVYDDSGCISTINIPVEVIPLPVVELITNPSGTSLIGQTITFTAMPAGYDLYEFMAGGFVRQSSVSNTWSTSDLKNGEEVTVLVKDRGCIFTSPTLLAQVKDLPNAFTPDGDGINDIFGAGYDLVVFNRWGQTIYKGFDGWDGTFEGRYVSPGTYYYIMNVIDANQRKSILKGSVTVIR